MSTASGLPTISRHGWGWAVTAADGSAAPWRRERVVLALGAGVELAGALREALDRRYVTVVEARPGEEVEAMRSCRPWPWLIAGDRERLPAEAVEQLRRHPSLIAWWRSPPPNLPGHTLVSPRFAGLVAAVQSALAAEVAGMRLAVGSGVDLPGGGHLGNAALEALVAAHPRPLSAAVPFAASAGRALTRNRLPVRPIRTPGGVVLAPLEEV